MWRIGKRINFSINIFLRDISATSKSEPLRLCAARSQQLKNKTNEPKSNRLRR